MVTLNPLTGVFVNTDEQMCWKPAVNWGDRSVVGWHMSRNRFPLNGTFSFFFSFSSFNSTCPTCSTWRPTTKSLSGLTSYLKQVDVEVATLPIVTAWSWAKGRNGHFGAALKPQCGGRNAKNHERVSGHCWGNSGGILVQSTLFNILTFSKLNLHHVDACHVCVSNKGWLEESYLSKAPTQSRHYFILKFKAEMTKHIVNIHLQ